MAKTEYLLQLYRAHVADLNDVFPGIGDVFLCPLCLRKYTEEDIYNKLLSDGHVWPLEMRNKSTRANNLSILLCKECNNSAGSKGDWQMQLHEKITNISENGEVFGIRTVEVTETPGEKPIRMRVKVYWEEKDLIRLEGSLNNQKQWLGSSPEDQARFIELSKRSEETQLPLSFTVLSPQEYKPNLVGLGWITSAYLMAFYTLGYRYILHQDLNFIRQFILSSFDKEKDQLLEVRASDEFHIYTDSTVKYADPEIRISIPISENGKVCLEVCFLQYEISLPILLEPNLLISFKKYCLEQVSGQPLPSLMEGNLPCIQTYIHCTKTVEHT